MARYSRCMRTGAGVLILGLTGGIIGKILEVYWIRAWK